MSNHFRHPDRVRGKFFGCAINGTMTTIGRVNG